MTMLPPATPIMILVSLVIAFGCGHYAKQRGRDPKIWLVAGFFFGILALIVLFFLPPKKVIPKPQQPVQPPAPPLTILHPDHTGKLWYFLDTEQKQYGPMSFDALNRAWNEGKVQEKTYVWNEAMENWQQCKDIFRKA